MKFIDKEMNEAIYCNTEADWQSNNLLKALENHDKKIIENFANELKSVAKRRTKSFALHSDAICTLIDEVLQKAIESEEM